MSNTGPPPPSMGGRMPTGGARVPTYSYNPPGGGAGPGMPQPPNTMGAPPPMTYSPGPGGPGMPPQPGMPMGAPPMGAPPMGAPPMGAPPMGGGPMGGPPTGGPIGGGPPPTGPPPPGGDAGSHGPTGFFSQKGAGASRRPIYPSQAGPDVVSSPQSNQPPQFFTPAQAMSTRPIPDGSQMGGAPPMGPRPGVAAGMGGGQVAPPPQMMQPPASQPGMAQAQAGMQNLNLTSTADVFRPGGTGGAQRAMDPNTLPRPYKRDPEGLLRYHSYPNQQEPIPPADSFYAAVDEGMSTPRFIRCTLGQAPESRDLLRSSNLPFAAIVQPFADVGEEEAPVPLVEFGESGPIRCTRCKAYINSLMKFVEGGRAYLCNICSMRNEVPHDYFSALDVHGRRRDAIERPELSRGSVEMLATESYMLRTPQHPAFLFVLDVSAASQQSALMPCVRDCIASLLEDIPEESRVRIGLITFDTTVHFYELKHGQEKFGLQIVGDIEDVFVPCPSSLVDVAALREDFHNMLKSLETIHGENGIGDAAMGAAVYAAAQALKDNGGKILVFQDSLPSVGIGKLRNRDDVRAYGTDKEKDLFVPQDGFYEKLASECVKLQISIDLFLCAQGYQDVATLSMLSRLTSGHVRLYPNFAAHKDAEKLWSDIRRSLRRKHAWEAIMRVRCSQGLEVKAIHGNFQYRSGSEIEFPVCDSDSTFSFELEYTDKLNTKADASFQVAVLFTSSEGQRVIRVHNYAVPVTNALSSVFKYCNCEAVVSVFAREAALQARKEYSRTVRETLLTKVVQVLSAYRKFLGHNIQQGTLLLPDALQLMPLYVLSFVKSPLLRPGTNTRVDERALAMSSLPACPDAELLAAIHPRFYPLHLLPNEEPAAPGQYVLPESLPLSSEKLEASGMYLLEDSEDLLVYVGAEAPSEMLRDVFGVDIRHERPAHPVTVHPAKENNLSKQVVALVDCLRHRRRTFLPITVILPKEPLESRFMSCMVEDRTQNTQSYVEFLTALHKEVLRRGT